MTEGGSLQIWGSIILFLRKKHRDILVKTLVVIKNKLLRTFGI